MTDFFLAVKKAAMDRGLQIAPAEVMTDYELALVQSLLLAFPGAVQHGCHFHFAQCLWRRVQRLGLVEEYKDNPEIRKFIQSSAALAFVPLNFVRIAWTGLKALMPDDQRLGEFAGYFENTWLNG